MINLIYELYIYSICNIKIYIWRRAINPLLWVRTLQPGARTNKKLASQTWARPVGVRSGGQGPSKARCQVLAGAGQAIEPGLTTSR